ncbi:hypothetical protein QTO34_004584 [Cnephaeus nilssonii]|uniref:Uncharacterized protein n=1 Tax=Cnephaeus nilssonii TaxID=3371016 RepID=A0AA40LKH8_CNENI|nr:hypothetical protein QTO34_004584 [Eptesicus nilssonii]
MEWKILGTLGLRGEGWLSRRVRMARTHKQDPQRRTQTIRVHWESPNPPVPEFPDFFWDKHSFPCGEFPGEKGRQLSRDVTAFNGEPEDYMSHWVQFVIRAQEWDPSFEEAVMDRQPLPGPQHLDYQHNAPEGDQFKDTLETSMQRGASEWGFSPKTGEQNKNPQGQEVTRRSGEGNAPSHLCCCQSWKAQASAGPGYLSLGQPWARTCTSGWPWAAGGLRGLGDSRGRHPSRAEETGCLHLVAVGVAIFESMAGASPKNHHCQVTTAQQLLLECLPPGAPHSEKQQTQTSSATLDLRTNYTE